MTEASMQANHLIEPLKPSMRWRVLCHILITGPRASSQVEAALRLKHQTASARLKELEEFGVLASRGFGYLRHPGKPDESLYGLTADGRALMSHPDAAQRLVDVEQIHASTCKERSEFFRDIRREWTRKVAAICTNTLRTVANSPLG